MAKKHYSASSEAAHLIAEVTRISPQDRLDIYGVEILDDDTVYDDAYGQKFNSIQEWAKFYIGQDSEQFDDFADDYSGKYDNEDY